MPLHRIYRIGDYPYGVLRFVAVGPTVADVGFSRPEVQPDPSLAELREPMECAGQARLVRIAPAERAHEGALEVVFEKYLRHSIRMTGLCYCIIAALDVV